MPNVTINIPSTVNIPEYVKVAQELLGDEKGPSSLTGGALAWAVLDRVLRPRVKAKRLAAVSTASAEAARAAVEATLQAELDALAAERAAVEADVDTEFGGV